MQDVVQQLPSKQTTEEQDTIHTYGRIRLAVDQYGNDLDIFEKNTPVDLTIFKDEEDGMFALILSYSSCHLLDITKFHTECGFYAFETQGSKLVIEEDPLCGEDATLARIRYNEFLGKLKLEQKLLSLCRKGDQHEERVE